MKFVIQLVLWVIIAALGYFIFRAVYGEVEFNNLKVVRYQKAVDKLKDIRSSQLAYKQITGKFAGDFDDLVRFVDTADFTITQRRDTTVLDKERTKSYGVDMYTEKVLIDTLGTKPVKDSLFGSSDRYKTMMNVPLTGDKKAEFEMQAGTITKNDLKIPVFEAKVAKDVILYDQPKDFLNKEKQVLSVDGINGAYISVGSMSKVDTSGNWPKKYGDEDE